MLAQWNCAGLSIPLMLSTHIAVKKLCPPNLIHVLLFCFSYRFCKGGMSEEEAFKAAIATWPAGVLSLSVP